MCQDKKAILDAAWCGASDEQQLENPDQMEVVFTTSQLGEQFYINLFTTFSARAIVDLSAGLGEAAKAAVVTKIPYLGFCLTEEHALQLELELTRWAGVCMGTQQHQLFDPAAPRRSVQVQSDQSKDQSKGAPPGPGSKPAKPAGKVTKRDRRETLSDSDSDSGDKKHRKKPQKKKGRKDVKGRATHASSGSDSDSG